MSEKKIYLLLTDTGTFFTRIVKLYTKKPYNHASIAFDQNLINLYSFGRKNARNPFSGGFVKESITGGLFKQARCAIYSCTVTAAQADKMSFYIQQIEAQKENYRYNLLGLFAVILNKKLKRDNAFFCSQFVATVLNQGDGFSFKKPLSLITPDDLQKSQDFHLIYKGKLADYAVCKERSARQASNRDPNHQGIAPRVLIE